MKSMFQALSAKKELPPELASFLHSKKLAGEFTVGALIAFIDSAVRYDVVGDRGRKTAGRLAIVALIAGVVLVFIGVSGELPVFFVLAAIAVIGAVIAFVIGSVLSGSDIPDHVQRFVAPLLLIFREDMKPSAKMAFQLDLTDPDASSKAIRTHKHPRGTLSSGTLGRTDTTYENRWFSLHGKLIDGSVLGYEVIDQPTKISVTKRSRSGKTKYKSKQKLRRLTKASLRPADLGAVLPAEPVPTSAADCQLRVKSKENGGAVILAQRLRKDAYPGELNPIPSIDEFTELAGEAFSQLPATGNPPESQDS